MAATFEFGPVRGGRHEQFCGVGIERPQQHQPSVGEGRTGVFAPLVRDGMLRSSSSVRVIRDVDGPVPVPPGGHCGDRRPRAIRSPSSCSGRRSWSTLAPARPGRRDVAPRRAAIVAVGETEPVSVAVGVGPHPDPAGAVLRDGRTCHRRRRARPTAGSCRHEHRRPGGCRPPIAAAPAGASSSSSAHRAS